MLDIIRSASARLHLAIFASDNTIWQNFYVCTKDLMPDVSCNNNSPKQNAKITFLEHALNELL